MNFFTTENSQTLLLGGYVLFSVALNSIALLISLFYRKKFNHASPRGGFLASIFFSLMYCALLAAETGRSASFHWVAQICLAASAIASVVCTVNLFLIMQKVRK